LLLFLDFLLIREYWKKHLAMSFSDKGMHKVVSVTFSRKVSPVQYKINAMYALMFGSKSQIGYQIGY